MTKMIFVSLPVAKLAASKTFYEALGFTFNPQFSDDTTASLVWSEAITVMLHTHAKWGTFTNRPIPPTTASEVMLAVSCDKREGVDAMNKAAAANGGTADINPVKDLGFMYNRSLSSSLCALSAGFSSPFTSSVALGGSLSLAKVTGTVPTAEATISAASQFFSILVPESKITAPRNGGDAVSLIRYGMPSSCRIRSMSVQSHSGNDFQAGSSGSRTPTGSDCGNAPSIIFYDRRGNVVNPEAQSIIKPRRGVFALVVAINDDAIMLSAERCAPDVPELPGGGIEDGETLDEAIEREWAEEVGIAFNVKGPLQCFQHVRGFYADDRQEFWIYDQTFRLYHFLDAVKTGQKWPNSEGGTAGWEAIGSLPGLLINRAHWCAIPTLLSGLRRL